MQILNQGLNEAKNLNAVSDIDADGIYRDARMALRRLLNGDTR
jgi:hypothetical protein